MQRKAFPLFLFISIFLFSCVPRKAPRVALPQNEQAIILQKVARYSESLQKIGSAKSYAKVRLRVRGYKTSFDEVIKIRFPFSFYFETLDDLANKRFVMASNGSTLFWQDYDRKEYYEGELDENSLRKFLPLAANLEETLGFFIGKLPVFDLQTAQIFKIDQGPQYSIKISRGEIIWDESQNAIVSLAFGKEGARVGFEYEGANFRRQTLHSTKESDVYIPSRVKLRDKKTKNEIEILYQDSELAIGNAVLPESISWAPLPDAKQIHELP